MKMLARKYRKGFHCVRRKDQLDGSNIFDTYWLRFRNNLSQRFGTCIHGHFPASTHYRDGDILVTFVRDPVERRISLWRYIQREYERDGIVYNNEWQLALRCNLDDFLSSPDHCYTNYLDVPLSEFNFIGSMEDFDADMERLANLLDGEYLQEFENAAPIRSQVTQQQKDAYAQANPQEIDIYKHSLARRDEIIG